MILNFSKADIKRFMFIDVISATTKLGISFISMTKMQQNKDITKTKNNPLKPNSSCLHIFEIQIFLFVYG